MKSPLKNPMSGPGYVVLNAIRVLNIVALLSAVIASWVMLVKTFVISKFFFFDAISHVITSVISMFLVVSELGLFKSYFDRNWPLLSPTSGFVGLGFAMIVVGVNILGNLNKQATSPKSLGIPCWRLVIASGIVVSILGLLNIIVSYLFRETRLDVSARQVRARGAVATQSAEATKSASSSHRSFRSRFSTEVKSALPSYHSTTQRVRSAFGPKLPLNISRPLPISPESRIYLGDNVRQTPEIAHPIYAQMTNPPIQVPGLVRQPSQRSETSLSRYPSQRSYPEVERHPSQRSYVEVERYPSQRSHIGLARHLSLRTDFEVESHRGRV